MADSDHNGIDDAEEIAAYKSRATSGKFKQQISYGVGAAMVFGLVTAGAKALFDLSLAGAGGSIALMPVLGLVALGAIGIGCLYLSAKFLSENTFHDQELQAKQINIARGKAKEAEMSPETPATETTNFPLASSVKSDAVEASNTDTKPQKKWIESFEKSPKLDIAALKAANDDSKSWGEKMTAAAASPMQTLSAL